MNRRDYEFIGTHVPQNKVAARVVSKGYSFTPTLKSLGNNTIWDDNPLLDVAPLRPTNAPNYTGIRRGNLVLIGYWSSSPSGSLWIARCDCGRFVARRAKKFADKPATQWDGCPYCEKEKFIINGRSDGLPRKAKTFKEFFGIKEE